MTIPVLLFTLPRSGSTTFCGIINQNPDFRVIEGSLSVSIINNLRSIFYTEAKSLATAQPNSCEKVLKSALSAYYGNTTSFVFDKNREWLFYLNIADQIFPRYKVVVLVRDPVECAASFLRLQQKEPLTWTKYDSDVVFEQTFPRAFDFAQRLLRPDGTIGRSYNALVEAAGVQNRHEEMLFIDYHKLCANPIKQIDRLCTFLECDTFYPQLDNIQNANKQLDRHYGMFDTMHTIEKVLRPAKSDLSSLELFKNELSDMCTPFWTDWT